MVADTETRSKILVFGGTGYLGKHVVRASLMFGHPTYVYVRPIAPDTYPSEVQLFKEFQSTDNVTIIQGQLSEQEKLVSTIKQVDIVISVLGTTQVIQQLNIIDAMQIAGNVKRFIPSDFGVDEDKTKVLHPFQLHLEKKEKIRRATEASGIPFTYLSSICFGGYFLNFFFHPSEESEELVIFGNGEAKVAYIWEKDIGIYTIKAANDERTRDRTVYFRPPKCVACHQDLVPLWEKKTGRSYKKVYHSEEVMAKLAETTPHPHNLRAAIAHSLFIKGDTTNFELEEDDLEVSNLYPDYQYTSVDEILDALLANPTKFEHIPL